MSRFPVWYTFEVVLPWLIWCHDSLLIDNDALSFNQCCSSIPNHSSPPPFAASVSFKLPPICEVICTKLLPPLPSHPCYTILFAKPQLILLPNSICFSTFWSGSAPILSNFPSSVSDFHPSLVLVKVFHITAWDYPSAKLLFQVVREKLFKFMPLRHLLLISILWLINLYKMQLPVIKLSELMIC